jgi:hypothetical protein
MIAMQEHCFCVTIDRYMKIIFSPRDGDGMDGLPSTCEVEML